MKLFNLKNREDGHDVVGIKISYSTVKKVINWFRRRKKSKQQHKGG